MRAARLGRKGESRMRKFAMVVAGVLILGSSALAQTDTLVGVRKGSIELGAAGGLSAPVGDYGDLADLSGTGAVFVGYYLSPRFSIGMDWGGHWHTASDQADSLSSGILGPNVTDVSFRLYRILTPYVKYQLKVAKVSPYLTGLTGFYLQEMKWSEMTPLSTVTQTQSQGYWGIAAGLGVQMVSDDNVVVFVDGKFHSAMRGDAAPVQFFDVRVGLAFLL